MIYIVGCNHGIQQRNEDALLGDPPRVKDQKSHFAGLIEKIIKEHGIQFVGEEWGLTEMTIASAIAGNDLRWANINTSPDELEAMEIPLDYVNRKYSSEQKGQWNRQREHVMVRKIQENRGDAERLLIVCGFHHLKPLADLLRKIDRSVDPIDYRDFSWYQAGVFTDDT